MNIPDSELKALVNVLDISGDGKISYTELKKFISSLDAAQGEVNMATVKKKVHNTMYQAIANSVSVSDTLKHYDPRGM